MLSALRLAALRVAGSSHSWSYCLFLVFSLLALLCGVTRGYAQSPSITVLNAGFETPNVGTGGGAYAYDPSGASWSFTGNAGISGNASGFTSGNPNAPEGNQVGLVQGISSFSQSLAGFQAGTAYTLTVAAAQRGNNGTSTQAVQVSMDGAVLGTLTPSSTSYSDFTFSYTPQTSGSHTLQFTGTNPNGGDNTVFLDNVRISPASTSAAPVQVLAINAGGGAISPFVADTDYDTGSVYSTGTAIDTSAVTSPAPQAVYQTERYGNFTYTLPGLTPGASYTLRLHFAEIFYGSPGQRQFNVFVNGTQVLTNFDIVAAAGGPNKAVIKNFSAAANSSGQIVVQFANGAADAAKVDGLEVLSAGSAPTAASITVSPASAKVNTGGTQQFVAVAKDQNGNPLSPQPAFTWSIGSRDAGTISSSGLYSAGTTAGSATVQATSGGVPGTATVSVAAQSLPAPYSGSPVTVSSRGATKIEAENYDKGGEGIAYHDTDNGGQTSYRSDNIGVYSDGSASNGYAVGWATTGEWDGYTLNVAKAGVYTLDALVATPNGGGTFHLEFGPVGQVGGAGVIQSSEFTTPNTGGWGGSYQPVSVATVSLPAGPLWMRLVVDSTYACNFDCFTLAPASTLASIAVSPPTATLNPNGTQQFTAVANDQNGNALSPQPAFTWSVANGGVGTVSSSGLYSAGTTAGSASVKAMSGAVSGSATVTVALGVPAAPTGLQATSTDAFVSLTWQPIMGAVSYNLYRTSNLSTPPTVIQSVQANSTIDNTITLGQTYYYQVSAVNAFGESPLSSPASITPTGNLRPVVKLTAPLSGITLTAGTNLLLTAAAAPRSGTISTVSFYYAPTQYDGSGNPVVAAGTLIGSASTTPYSFAWNSLPSGSFFLTAVATDSGGHTAISALVVVTVSAPVSGMVLTSTQAIQIARTFCQAIGAPISTGTPTSATVTAISLTYVGNVWQINFQGAASVEVADASGIVVSYFSYSLANQLNANTQAPGTPITQAQAQTVAASVLQASQQPVAGLANQQFTQSNLLYPATYAGDLWTVRWNRAVAGIPYRHNQATLLLQAETGGVEAWKLAFPTPVPASTASTVTQSQAQQIAQSEMTAAGSYLGLTNQVFQTAQQAVVQPNTLWPSGGSTTPGTTTPIPGSPSHVVWDCYFSNSTASKPVSGTVSSEVWVDAVSGQVVGGDVLQVKSHRPTRHMPLQPLVPMAKDYR